MNNLTMWERYEQYMQTMRNVGTTYATYENWVAAFNPPAPPTLYAVRTATVGDFSNAGSTPQANLRWNGRGPAYGVIITNSGLEIGYKRKMDAVAFATWAKVERPDGFDVGDPELAFLQSDAGLQHITAHDWKGEV